MSAFPGSRDRSAGAPSAVAGEAPSMLCERYELLEQIGRGAFSIVRRARDHRTGRHVAVKMLAPGPWQLGVDARATIEDFEAGIRLCASVVHRGIAGLLDVGTTPEGLPFAVFDLVDGSSLRERLDHGPAIDRGTLLRLLAEVLEALGAAHAQGIVHRDVKPENILVTGVGLVEHAVLVDFGLGNAAAPADRDHGPTIVGTPRYAAPEQLRGQPATPRTDVYSWGMVAIECLGGASPIVAEAAHEAVREALADVPVEIPAALEPLPIASLLRRATSKDPALRPADANETLRALALVEGHALGIASDLVAPGTRVRRDVTIVSCRLHDPSDAPGPSHEEAARSCATSLSRCGAVVLSVLADRVVVGFGLRGDDDHHARRAVAAAMEWLEGAESGAHERRGVWSIGIHSGRAELDLAPMPATTTPAGLFGPLTTTALALDSAAPSGRVAVSASTRELVGAEWSFAATPLPLESAAAFQVRRRRASDAGPGPSSTLAGRDAERAALALAWTEAAAGRPRALLVQGEPGIGKSRLVQELARSFPDADRIEVRCSPEQQAKPYGALAQAVAAFGGSVRQLAARYRMDPAEAVPILAMLLGEPLPAGHAMPVATPDRLKQITLGIAVRLLHEAARDEPLALVVEDVQWADAASIEWITHLLDRAGTSGTASDGPPLLIVLTARPDFTSPWSTDVVVPMNLRELEAADVETLIAARYGEERPLDPGLLRRAVAACRGVPLFAEEAAFLLAAAARATDDGDTGAMPASVDGLLRARMRALSPRALEIAGAAAAVGQEFRLDVVQAVVGSVGTSLGELLEARLVVAGDAHSPVYAFRHALLRDAAYEAVAEQARPALHLRIAKVIREKFPELAAGRPADLALHYEKGGDAMHAAELWHQAGTGAMASASYLEAQRLFTHGLATVTTAPATLARAQRELGLTTGLATAHLSVEGYGAAVTREHFSRARSLCAELGLEAPLEVLGGIFGASLVTSDNDGMASLLSVFRTLADRSDRPAHAVAGHQMLGVHGFWSGRYRQARLHSSTAMEIYRRPWVRDTSWEYGFGLYCYAYGMSAEFQLGYADRAEAIRQEMLRLAGESRNPYTLALALGFATTLTKDTGRPAETMQLANRLLAMSLEQHLYIWYAFGNLARGSALLQLGQPQDALAQIRSGLSMLETFGFHCSWASYLTYLAEALLACGEIDEALATADLGLEQYRTHWTRFSEPDMVRLRGQALEARGDDDGAAREYRRAIEIARADEGLWFEIRAATALARLLARHGDRGAALATLEPLQAKFTEGFWTGDFTRAGGLLEELRRPT